MLSHFKKWIATALISISSVAGAAEFEAGTHYKVLEEPAAVMQDGKIHVEEAFWYGCSHCYELEPKVNPWKKNLADDVAFQRVPAMFGRAWVVHAQLYYTADALNVLDQVHSDIFDAIHLQKRRLVTREDQRDFIVSKTDITPEAFDKAYDSFAVNSRMKRGDQRIRSFKIGGVPTLIINGKYVIDATSAGSQEAMLDVADYLINQVRGN